MKMFDIVFIIFLISCCILLVYGMLFSAKTLNKSFLEQESKFISEHHCVLKEQDYARGRYECENGVSYWFHADPVL